MSNAPIIHKETFVQTNSGPNYIEGTVTVTYFGYTFEVRARKFDHIEQIAVNGLTKGLEQAKKEK